ncbi:hypothetical protein V8E55_005679, partial [Tylopilus felleus]
MMESTSSCRASPERTVFEVERRSRIARKPIELSTGICAPPIFVVTGKVASNRCLTISTGHLHSVPVPRITSSTFRFQWLP